MWSLSLQFIWFVANGDWEASYHMGQNLETPEGSLIHAYSHRKEGHGFNFAYWYRQANTTFPNISLEDELKEIVTSLL